MNGWFVILDADVSDGVLGEAILEAFSHCRTGVPDPSPEENLFAPMLKRLGVRSWAQYNKGVVSVSVSREDEVVKVLPMRSLGSKGHDHLEDLAVKRTAPSPAEIGRLVRAGLG